MIERRFLDYFEDFAGKKMQEDEFLYSMKIEN